jgi:hypothetical protein
VLTMASMGPAVVASVDGNVASAYTGNIKGL